MLFKICCSRCRSDKPPNFPCNWCLLLETVFLGNLPSRSSLRVSSLSFLFFLPNSQQLSVQPLIWCASYPCHAAFYACFGEKASMPSCFSNLSAEGSLLKCTNQATNGCRACKSVHRQRGGDIWKRINSKQSVENVEAGTCFYVMLSQSTLKEEHHVDSSVVIRLGDRR